MSGEGSRRRLKRLLAARGTGRRLRSSGMTVLIYHRVGGESVDERDLAAGDFAAQLNALDPDRVIPLDTAADRLVVGDSAPSVVLTFDDGFADVHANAWPLLRAKGLPFTIYVSTDYVGGTMRWDGSTATVAGAGLSWDQLGEMADSGLCTIGNHTASHARPAQVDEFELDRCSDTIEKELGIRPLHYADTWGVRPPGIDTMLRARFRTAATGRVGRNRPGCELLQLRRIPVRRTDPIEFFHAKLAGTLIPERAYSELVRAAKAVRIRG